MKTKNLFMPFMMILSFFVFIQCSNDDEFDPANESKGQVALSLTDAPSDDANIRGTFVTVSEIKIDGKVVEGFTKQTIEISAYQKGNAKLIFNGDVVAKSYSSVSLVLDYETDASGNSPGCYVLTTNNQKHRLGASSETKAEITMSKNFSVDENSDTELVIDFDLRKSIVRDTSSQGDYRFVTKTEMNNTFRIVIKDHCGVVAGKVNVSAFQGGDLYVFVYKKGQYSWNTESVAQGSSNVFFAKAVTSSKVEQDGSYNLAFLEEGNYEVYIATYEKDNSGKSVFKGMVNATSAVIGLFLNNITVSSQSQVQLNINLIGLN